jgi:hypothetical protein
MKIQSIHYQKIFPLAPYVNETIGVDIAIDAGDSLDNAIQIAKSTVERWHKELNPQLFNGSQPQANGEIPVTQVEKPLSKDNRMIADIKTCKDIKILETYKFIVKGKPELQAAYDSQLKTLSNGLVKN